MKQLIAAALCSLLLTNASFAQAPATSDASSCEAKAVSKDGKPLSGAAKTSSIKKCEADAAAAASAACEPKAVSKDGKPLSGAAKTSFMKKCQADAAGGK